MDETKRRAEAHGRSVASWIRRAGEPPQPDWFTALDGPLDRSRLKPGPHTTLSGSSFCPVGPTWMSVPISGQTPQS